MDGGAWKAVVHGVAEGRTRLSDFTFTFHFHALENEMATHSSVLAWRIPGMGEPGGLASMGSQSRTRLKRLSIAYELPSLLNRLNRLRQISTVIRMQSFWNSLYSIGRNAKWYIQPLWKNRLVTFYIVTHTL